MDKPTYLRAAIRDWKAERISLERLCEIWGVNFYAIHRSFCIMTGKVYDWQMTSVKRIEEVLEATKH